MLVAASYPRTWTCCGCCWIGGADIRAQDGTGATALSFAVRSADVDVVRFLVEKGLDPNALSAGRARVGFAR